MSYERAKEALNKDASRTLADPESYDWNLTMALLAFVEAVEDDIQSLRDRLAVIEDRLENRER